MKAVILVCTLKRSGISNTRTLSEFFAKHLQQNGVDSEILNLVDENVLPGTYDNMGDADAWPAILQKMINADIIIFATPIWWGNHSSEMQKAIERLDHVHDEILAGNKSRLENKVAGILITGDSDGSQHIIGNIRNFLNAIGVLVPPYATLSVLWQGQAKGVETPPEELMKKYEEEYAQTAETMIAQLKKYL